MSFETVLSVVESATGGVSTTVRVATAAEAVAYDSAPWVARIRYLRSMGMYKYIADWASWSPRAQAAIAQIAAEESAATAAATTAAANASAAAAEGTLVAGAGTTAAAIAIPVIAMVAIGVALGAPYYKAREEAKAEGYSSGFAQGFVTGLLKWPLHTTIAMLWDNAVQKNPFDEVIPTLRATAFNTGLIKGRAAALCMIDPVKKKYLRALHTLSHASSAGWKARSDYWLEQARARQVQLTYVIDMASAARKFGIIKAE